MIPRNQKGFVLEKDQSQVKTRRNQRVKTQKGLVQEEEQR
jgi:hypothetical protein